MTSFKIFMSRNIRAIGVLILAALVAYSVGRMAPNEDSGRVQSTDENQAQMEAPERWTCAMHPQIILPNNDQKCPICFMDLISLRDDFTGSVGGGDLTLSREAAALADVETAKVERTKVFGEVRLVGKVASDESLTRTITARVSGRLEKLYVDATGQVVDAGMDLAEIYSPELYAAQVELRAAAAANNGEAEDGPMAQRARENLTAASERLRLWGMTDQQILAIAEGGPVRNTMTISSPISGTVISRNVTQGDHINIGSVLYEIADLSRVWLVLEAFESDLSSLAVGQTVSVATRAYPGQYFQGDIVFINSVLNEKTRTVEVRVEVENEGGRLKPGMLVTAVASIELDAEGNPVLDKKETLAPLVIPASAPLLTGSRAIVYVKTESESGLVFTGRQVQLGPRAGDVFVVLVGLRAGEEVVTRGSFKIDSALQIQAEPSMMDPVSESQAAPLEEFADFVPDCIVAGVGSAVQDYYVLQAALGNDADDESQLAAASIVGNLQSLSCDEADMPRQIAARWRSARADLLLAAQRTADAKTLAIRRQQFEELSDQLWIAATNYLRSTDTVVNRFHCPMAADGAGAHWLQPNDETVNPYYGKSMLRCGSQVAAIDEAKAGR